MACQVISIIRYVGRVDGSHNYDDGDDDGDADDDDGDGDQEGRILGQAPDEEPGEDD